MKIAFSTLACPDFSWSDIYSMASDLGFDGIEIRGLGEDIFAVSAPPFKSTQISKTVEKLKDLNLEIPCLSSNCCLKEDSWEDISKEISEYCSLAKKLNTKYVRILADKRPQPNGEIDDKGIADKLSKLTEIAKSYNVILLVETNGVYCDTKRLKALLDMVNSPFIQALWDIHHPYRFLNETPKETVENLGKYIKYVHAKDSVSENGKTVYKLMGQGDLPLSDMFKELKNIGFNGYISLEWVKRWTPWLDDAGVVFPHFIDYMRKELTFGNEQQAVSHKSTTKTTLKRTGEPLQDNIAKNGKYVWRKERLIDYTFPQVLDRMCEEFPEQYLFRYTECDYTRTYPQFRDDVDTFARALIAMGVNEGDKVAIWATNIPAWYITFWATVKIGAVLVTVNTAYKIHEAEYLLKQSDTHTLITIDGALDSNYIGILQELCPELETCEKGQLQSEKLPFLRNIIHVNIGSMGYNPTIDNIPVKPTPKGMYSWDEAMATAEKVSVEEVYRRANAMDINDVCNMQYTSGTTGFPKGVMLTHYNVVNNGKAIGDCIDFSTADKLLIHVPMFHCFGMVLGMTAAMTHGTTIVPMPYFNAKKSLSAINKEKVTACHGVPTMFIAMLEHADFEKTDFSYMRTGLMAGSPCPVKVMQDVLDKMKIKDICITYGQTESSPACTNSRTTDSMETRVNTVGSAIFGVECKIFDPETNEELPDNVDGEFVARGYNIMKGYYKMPEATASAIDKNGWLHTGDLARRLPDGNFKITGRIKDMIIRGGENLYPKEIEDFYYTHPSVKDVQVIGIPSKQYGEEAMACIILKAGETTTAEELLEFAKTRIARHKVPKYIRFVDSFPMNAAGKILKYKMRESAVEYLNLQEENKIITA
ncbi:MAG: AMP-binding protein [Oscillospiraceae bacterium]|jgi:fatty-acyl-CoA synthase|nr:AMP-binding protein [Oscillospiraceae bacterium]